MLTEETEFVILGRMLACDPGSGCAKGFQASSTPRSNLQRRAVSHENSFFDRVAWSPLFPGPAGGAGPARRQDGQGGHEGQACASSRPQDRALYEEVRQRRQEDA